MTDARDDRRAGEAPSALAAVAGRMREAAAFSRHSLAEFAYDVLRETIRQRSLDSGARVRESDVAEQLGISRTPVREAFRRLVSEGLLVPGPWNGMTVVKLNRQEVVELYLVRESLEGTAAALAADHATAAERQFLLDIIERERRTEDLEEHVRINAELHQEIYNAAHNRYLLRSLGSIADVLGLLRFSSFLVPGSAEGGRREHAAIVKAIAERDAVAAEAAARHHIREALRWRLQLMAGTEPNHGREPRQSDRRAKPPSALVG